MKEYRIGPEGLKAFRKLLLKRMLIAVPFIRVIVAINVLSYSSRDKTPSLGFWLIFATGMALFFGFLVYTVIRKNERLFKSYVLTVENILIRREQWNTPEVDIYFNEIVEIRKTKSRWLIVKGKYAGDVIFIPPYLDNFNELEQALQEVKPFTTKVTGTFFEKYRPILALGSLLSIVIAIIVNDKIIDSICVCIYCFITIRNFIDARKNKNIDNRTRKKLWIQLVMAALIVTIVILKISDNLGNSISYLFPSSK